MNIRCSYCGDTLEALLEYTGGPYSEHRDHMGYECESYKCSARWDAQGDLVKPPLEGAVGISYTPLIIDYPIYPSRCTPSY